MYSPTTRLLTVLELLQARGRVGGRELAERLEVDPRSVRRYVTMLQDLGIPVTSERGRHGGYRIRPGFRLPPMMFTQDEALALTLALLIAQRTGMVGAAPALEGVLAKVDRVLPEAIRDQLMAVQETLSIDLPFTGSVPAAADVLALGTAARERRRVHLRYRSDREETERDLDPYGLVCRNGRWYVVGWCHLRRDVRIFRLDRVVDVRPLAAGFVRPEGFDAGAHLVGSLASAWTRWTIEVVLEAPLADARRWISPVVGSLEERPDGVLLRSRADDLGWMAAYLMLLPWPARVLRPRQLLDALRDLQRRIDGCVAASGTAQPVGSTT